MSGHYLRCDLHIHSCLSPCADILMTPGNIVMAAVKKGLDCIAITDHNAAGNVQVAMELAKKHGLKVIPGMEVETKEEVHLLCLFSTLEGLLTWEKVVFDHLPELLNDEDTFGYQLIVDIHDEYAAKEERLLATATSLSCADVVAHVSQLGGIVIPSHVDRPVNSIIGQLGFIPPDLGIEVIEVSRHVKPENLFYRFPDLQFYLTITGSDSHFLNDIGNCGSENGFLVSGRLYQLLEPFCSSGSGFDRY